VLPRERKEVRKISRLEKEKERRGAMRKKMTETEYRVEKPPYPGYIISTGFPNPSIYIHDDDACVVYAQAFGYGGKNARGAKRYLNTLAQSALPPDVEVEVDTLDAVFEFVYPNGETPRDIDYERKKGEPYAITYVGDIRDLSPSGKRYTLSGRSIIDYVNAMRKYEWADKRYRPLLCSRNGGVTNEDVLEDIAYWDRQARLAEWNKCTLMCEDDSPSVYAIRR